MRKVTRKQAEDAVGEAHRDQFPTRGFREDYPNHFLRWEDNLSRAASSSLIEQDFGAGSGNELTAKPPKPPKFCATYSSSALCSNSFLPARENPSWLRYGDLSGFCEFRFEWKLETGLGGTPPNLDFVATSGTSILAVESKFLETLNPKKPEFADSYDDAFANCGCSVLDSAYRSIQKGESSFYYLNAAQLLKHALGVIHYSSSAGQPVSDRTLGYIFWEPENHSKLEPYLTHREELASFETLIEGSKVNFLSMNYKSLWKAWQKDSSTNDHANALARRYSLSL